MTRLTQEREAEDVIRDHLNNPDMFGILSHTQGMALLKVIDTLRAENAKLKEFYDTHVNEQLGYYDPKSSPFMVENITIDQRFAFEQEIKKLKAENATLQEFCDTHVSERLNEPTADKRLIAELENKLWLGVEREEKLKAQNEQNLALVHYWEKSMDEKCASLHEELKITCAHYMDRCLERDELKAENAKLKSQLDGETNWAAIAKNAEERIEKLRISLGQIKTMTDDCQGMSRYVASVFDKHVDKALAADDELARGVK